MKIKTKIKFLVLLLLLNCDCFAQHTATQVFKIYSLPENLLEYKTKLNEEIKIAQTKDEVRKILKAKIQNFNNGRIVILYNKSQWFTINAGYKNEETKDIIITQTKDVEKHTIDYKRDFKQLFKDTVVILDTLSLNVFLQDEDDYPARNYYFEYSCGKNKPTKYFIPVVNETLLNITDAIFKNCKSKRQYVRLFNSADGNKVLANCMVVFLTREETEELTHVVQQFLSDNNQDVQTTAQDVYAFISTCYGKASMVAVNDLITKIINQRQ